MLTSAICRRERCLPLLQICIGTDISDGLNVLCRFDSGNDERISFVQETVEEYVELGLQINQTSVFDSIALASTAIFITPAFNALIGIHAKSDIFAATVRRQQVNAIRQLTRRIGTAANNVVTSDGTLREVVFNEDGETLRRVTFLSGWCRCNERANFILFVTCEARRTGPRNVQVAARIRCKFGSVLNFY